MREYWRKLNNDQARKLWDSKTSQLFEAIESCLAKDFWEPAIILLYSGIDAMAWLDRPQGVHDVTGPDFMRWCDAYLLIPADAAMTSTDLWGARCGLLHSHTGESKKHRERKATKIFYSRMRNGREINLIQTSSNEHVLPLWVDVDLLFARFKDGVSRFQADLASDDARAQKVYDRVNRSYLIEVDVESATPTDELE